MYDYFIFSMVSNKCVVFGCTNPAKRKYIFPINDHDFEIWVKRSSNPDLNGLSKTIIRKRYQICANHFDSNCISPGTNQKLKFRSHPTLNLIHKSASPLNWSNRLEPSKTTKHNIGIYNYFSDYYIL